MSMISIVSTFVLGVAALSSLGCATQPRHTVAPASAACHQLENPREAASAFYAPGAATSPRPIEESDSRQDWVGRLVGAELFVRATPGTTPEYLQRALMCHAVDTGPAASPNDPMRPAGGLMEVRVRSAGHGFKVAIYGNNLESSKDVLARARAMTGGPLGDSVEVRQVSMAE